MNKSIEISKKTFLKLFSADDYQGSDVYETHSEAHYFSHEDEVRGKVTYSIVSDVFQYYLYDINS